MHYLDSIELNEQSKEEILPGFAPDFPYIASCVELSRYTEPVVPWHWHRTVELFYVQSGALEYTTPEGNYHFPAGSGGFVNANVLHTTRVLPSSDSTVQLLHLFDPTLLAGEHGSRIEEKYILPLTTAGSAALLPLYPENAAQAEILQNICRSFALQETEWGYEFKLRECLSQIWLQLFDQARPAMEQGGRSDSTDKIKALLLYIHAHVQQPISVDALARSAHISKRACFRLFRETLHMTPVEYIQSLRIQMACRMLVSTGETMTRIAFSCGFESSSYFGKVFREAMGCSPTAYRKNWHDRKKIRH